MKLRELFIWINLFTFVISLLLCVFFFEKIWGLDKSLVSEFSKGDCQINQISIKNRVEFWPCNSENDNLWWYVYFKDEFYQKVVLKGSDPRQNIDPEIDNGEFSNCFHGIISVSFNYSNPLDNDKISLAHSNITGLFSANQTWVQGYLEPYIYLNRFECYYKPLNPYQVLPFLPSISSIGLIWGFIFLALTVISFITILTLLIYRYKYRKGKYMVFVNNNGNNNNNSLNNSSSSLTNLNLNSNRKSNNIGATMTSNSGKISTAGIVSSTPKNITPANQSNTSSPKKKQNIIESTLEFTDFSFNLQQATNQNQKQPQSNNTPPKSSLKQPSSIKNNNNTTTTTTTTTTSTNVNNNNSPPISVTPPQKKNKHLVIIDDNDSDDDNDQLLTPSNK